MSFAIYSRINISSYWQKYFGWAKGTYLDKTSPVFYMFDSKNKILETKFRSRSFLKEQMNCNFIKVDLLLQVSLKSLFRFQILVW